ncbi:MAG: DUF4861 family protein [Bacteroidaceae bacterium]|nr:DUF4861 family protein [Bacteroidaceae bacterium]
MKRILVFALCVLFLPSQGRLGWVSAQVAAHMKLWDRKYRYPRVNQVEFQGDVPQLAMYDAIYGHGAMWENEWIGFRVYMDHRQSIDLYGKKKMQLELDSTNFYTTPAQWQSGYGEDILFVGASIGAGSFRAYDEQGGLAFVSPVKARGQRVLSEGPDTAVVEIYATDWQHQGRTLQFRQCFTALRGHREVQVDVWLEDTPSPLTSHLSLLPPLDSLTFATGVQKFEFNTSGFMRSDGLVASWGSNVPDKEGHPDRVHTLGMAVRVDEANLVDVKEDDLNYLCLIHPVAGHMRYWLSAASDMQQEGIAFHSAEEWFRWVKYDSFK